ncbi:MAG: AAA family ATPase [Methylovulum miyakonense]|uniref:AAA family ATPase n=1 Tax=Methylovulum miyakonense TaxID=645578 RepID=UPI003BB7C72C
MNITFTEAYSEDDKALVRSINAWIKDSGKSKADLSRRTGIPDGTRSGILNGSYPSSPTEFLLRMAAEMGRTDERNQSAKVDIPFVATSIYADIEYACRRAHIDCDFGIFVGQVGIGKTTGLRNYAQKNRAAVLIEAFDGIDHSTFISELVKAAGLASVTGNTSQQVARLIGALKGSDKMILVDEANSLKPFSFGALRRISDTAGIGVMLVGTHDLLPMVQDPAGRFGQISSRIGFWPELVSRIPAKDCALMVDSYFGEPQPEPIVKAFYSHCEGSARALKNLLKNTCRYAIKNNADITPELIGKINADALAGRGYKIGGA